MSREMVPFVFEPKYEKGENMSDDSSDQSNTSNAQVEVEDAGVDLLGSTDWYECECSVEMAGWSTFPPC